MASQGRHVASLAISAALVIAGVAIGLTLPIAPLAVAAPPRTALDAGELMHIFSHNAMVGVRLALGAMSLGVFAVMQLAWCGLSASVVWHTAVAAGISRSTALLLMAPHGVFELSGFVLLGSLEFETAGLVRRHLRGEAPPDGSIMLFTRRAALGLALIGAAALVEVFVTPALPSLVGR